MPTHRLDFFGNVARAAPFCALERHVFNEMRNPIQPWALIPRPGINPNAHRRGREMRRIFTHDPQAVVELRQPRFRHRYAALARSATKA